MSRATRSASARGRTATSASDWRQVAASPRRVAAGTWWPCGCRPGIRRGAPSRSSSKQPLGEPDRRFAGLQPAAGGPVELDIDARPLGHAHDVDRPGDAHAHDGRLGHGLGQPADAAAGPELATQRAGALGKDSDAFAVVQRGHGCPASPRRCSRPRSTGMWPISVISAPTELVLPQRRLRQGVDLAHRSGRDRDRDRVPVAVVISDEQRRPAGGQVVQAPHRHPRPRPHQRVGHCDDDLVARRHGSGVGSRFASGFGCGPVAPDAGHGVIISQAHGGYRRRRARDGRGRGDRGGPRRDGRGTQSVRNPAHPLRQVGHRLRDRGRPRGRGGHQGGHPVRSAG